MKIGYKEGFWILFVISLVAITILGAMNDYSEKKYNICIKKCAERVVLGIELTSAPRS